MKVLSFIVLIVLVMAAVLALAGCGLLTGRMPSDLGIHGGRLKPPASTPNSVSSQADLYPEHPQKAYAQIPPLSFTGDPDTAMHQLAGILLRTPGAVMIAQQPDYLYAQCSTAMLKFTDDVEFWLDRKAGVIHVRSASRLGHSDLGANRARIEKIRAQFQKN